MDERQALQAFIDERDPEAFHVLMNAYHGLVFRASLRIAGDASLAEDVTQETFIRLLNNATKLVERQPLNLGGWLYRCAYNIALKYRESDRARSRRERDYARDASSLSGGEVTPLLDELDACIMDLTEQDRNLIIDHHLNGKTQSAMAEAANISQPAMRKRLAKAMDNLKRVANRRGVICSAGLLLLGMKAASAIEPPAHLSLSLAKMATILQVKAPPVQGLLGSMNPLWWVAGATAISVPVAALMIGSLASPGIENAETHEPLPAITDTIPVKTDSPGAEVIPKTTRDTRRAGSGHTWEGELVLHTDFAQDHDWETVFALMPEGPLPMLDGQPTSPEITYETRLSTAGETGELLNEPGELPGLLKRDLLSGDGYRIRLTFTTEGPGTFFNIFALAVHRNTPWTSRWENREVSHSLGGKERQKVEVDLLRAMDRSHWELSYSLDGIPMHRGRYDTTTSDLCLYSSEIPVRVHDISVHHLHRDPNHLEKFRDHRPISEIFRQKNPPARRDEGTIESNGF